MKRFRKRKKVIFLIFGLIFVGSFVATTAWATLAFVESQGSVSSGSMTLKEFTVKHSPLSRTRAPEPSTFALFGSGLLGIIISFLRKTYAIVKRILDIAISLSAIIFLAPLFLLTAVLILITSPGPVIFTQVRVGKNGRWFNIYKFRTMHVDAEKQSGPVWAAANDSRLIPYGKFLRKAHIDEIPQFLNVLQGDMSVVGPRPERPVFVEKLKREIPDYEKRLVVKPGITGLAQVWHRYDETIRDVKKKIKYDLLYIKKICLWTDLRILFRTVRVVFTGEGAR